MGDHAAFLCVWRPCGRLVGASVARRLGPSWGLLRASPPLYRRVWGGGRRWRACTLTILIRSLGVLASLSGTQLRRTSQISPPPPPPEAPAKHGCAAPSSDPQTDGAGAAPAQRRQPLRRLHRRLERQPSGGSAEDAGPFAPPLGRDACACAASARAFGQSCVGAHRRAARARLLGVLAFRPHAALACARACHGALASRAARSRPSRHGLRGVDPPRALLVAIPSCACFDAALASAGSRPPLWHES